MDGAIHLGYVSKALNQPGSGSQEATLYSPETGRPYGTLLPAISLTFEHAERLYQLQPRRW